MGTFDNFKYEAECPNCGRTKEFNFQTKELIQGMNCWEVGEKVEYLGHSDINLQVVGENETSRMFYRSTLRWFRCFSSGIRSLSSSTLG